MKKWRIEYSTAYEPSPLSFWVHRHLDSDVWSHAEKFAPKLPSLISGKGYPRLIVNVLDVELRFSSVEEVEHFLEIVRQKNMPTSTQLTQKRVVTNGPNGHWLSSLPSKLKPWTKRQNYIKAVEKGLSELKSLYP